MQSLHVTSPPQVQYCTCRRTSAVLLRARGSPCYVRCASATVVKPKLCYVGVRTAGVASINMDVQCDETTVLLGLCVCVALYVCCCCCDICGVLAFAHAPMQVHMHAPHDAQRT